MRCKRQQITDNSTRYNTDIIKRFENNILEGDRVCTDQAGSFGTRVHLYYQTKSSIKSDAEFITGLGDPCTVSLIRTSYSLLYAVADRVVLCLNRS